MADSTDQAVFAETISQFLVDTVDRTKYFMEGAERLDTFASNSVLSNLFMEYNRINFQIAIDRGVFVINERLQEIGGLAISHEFKASVKGPGKLWSLRDILPAEKACKLLVEPRSTPGILGELTLSVSDVPGLFVPTTES